MPKYEIYQRQKGQRREGHMALLIDGQDAMVTVDPAQFQEVALVELTTKEGHSKETPAAVQKLAEEMASYVLERKVEALRRGVPPSGPGLGNFRTAGMDGYTERQGRLRFHSGGEKRAVELFLKRGRLNGLDEKGRLEMLKAPNHDCEAEWQESRAKLIKQKEDELAKWEKEYQKGNPRAQKHVRWLAEDIANLKGSGIQNASHGFQYAFTQYWTGNINYVSNDIRIWPLMTNTTLDTLRDAVDTFSDVTVDEFDGANYTTGGLTLANKAVAVDDANDRAEFSADDVVVVSMGAGSRSIQGVGLGKFNTNTSSSLPLHWIEFATPKTPDGSNFTFDFSATDGIVHMSG